jgi:uncharacterized damage-inducible protein DinB
MQTIKKMFDHLHWANQRILQTLRQNGEGNQGAVRLFAHILNAENVWLSRIQGKDSSQLPLWQDADIDACARLVQQNEKNYTAFLAELTESGLDRFITYTNSKGKEFQSALRDILIHLALHGQYHRGQINSLLRADGCEAVNVDFITFVR